MLQKDVIYMRIYPSSDIKDAAKVYYIKSSKVQARDEIHIEIKQSLSPRYIRVLISRGDVIRSSVPGWEETTHGGEHLVFDFL